jgi:CRISPR-associated protein Csm3
MKLFKKIIIKGTFECLTGLHIGDSKDNVEIGGLDLPVIRRKGSVQDAQSNQPYIPGSSIKGKMRCLLQQSFGEVDEKLFEAKDSTTFLSTGELFGCLDSKEKENDKPKFIGNTSRLIVRDAYLENWKDLKESPYTDMPYTELKTENSIDRQKGTAENPRAIERVPAGAKFKVEFVINVFGDNVEEATLKATQYNALFNLGMELLQNDYLGGGGSRGSGQIKFERNIAVSTDIDIQSKVNEYVTLMNLPTSQTTTDNA